jgi:deoxyribodipyrimidine photo-lyase
MQSERFDPEGKFIKKYIPELQGVPTSAIHEPKAKLSLDKFKKTGYPSPVVDHAQASKAFKEAFKIAVQKK